MSCTHKMAASNLAASELHSDTLPAKPIETGQLAPQSHLPESQARPKLQQSHSQQSQPSQAPIQTLPPTSTTSATNKLPLTSSVSQKEAARQSNPPLKSHTSAQQSPTSNKSDSAFSTSSSSTCSPTNESCNLSELTSSSSSQSSTLSSSSSLDEGNISTDSSSAVQSLVVSISSSDSRGEKKNESSSECDNNHEEPAVETTGSDLPATTAGFSRPKQDGLSTSEDEGSSVCSSFTRPTSQASNHLQGTKHQGLATSTSSPTPETATTGAADSNSSSSSSNSSTCDAYATKFAYDGHQLNPYLNQAPAPYLMSHQHVPLMVQLPPAHLYGAQYGSRSGAEHLMANYCTLLPTAYTPQPAIYTAVPHTYPYHQYQQLFLLPAPIPPQQSHPLPPHQPHHSHHHHHQQQQHHLHHNYNNHQHNFQPTTVAGQGSGIEEHDYHGHYATTDSASLYSHPANHQQLALVSGQLLQPRVGLPPFVPAYYAPMRSQTLPTTTLNAMSLQASQQPPFPTMMYAESLLNVPIDQSTMGFFEGPSVTTSASHTDGSPLMAFSQLKLGYNLIPMLPIDAPPTQTRQAYGMDKVWHEEFEHLFSQFVSSIVWTLLEVEFNPSLIDCDSIVGYRGRYLIRAGNSSHSLASGSLNEDENEVDDTSTSTTPQHTTDRYSEGSQSIHCEDHDNDQHVSNDDESDSTSVSSNECHSESTGGSSSTRTDDVQVTSTSDSIKVNETESDCDSGAVVNSTSGCSEPSTKSSSVEEEEETSRSVTAEDKINESAGNNGKPVRRFPTRFRMFIDSAKVRFCCDHCGHGWTSMKGRVVFWYELFELVDLPEHMSIGGHNLIGYCAYKLFGQQCDVCKIENRFERPMWYPEEVTKVLNNLYNKIGQVYFGFKMPAIDKQRRAGKPRTSHNSSLCQACHDGVCTDRK